MGCGGECGGSGGKRGGGGCGGGGEFGSIGRYLWCGMLVLVVDGEKQLFRTRRPKKATYLIQYESMIMVKYRQQRTKDTIRETMGEQGSCRETFALWVEYTGNKR